MTQRASWSLLALSVLIIAGWIVFRIFVPSPPPTIISILSVIVSGGICGLVLALEELFRR